MSHSTAAIRGRARRTVYVRLVALLCIIANPTAAWPLKAEPPKRIVSINACTDQLLFALADRNQIAALTNYAIRDDFSIYQDEVKKSGIKLIRGGAEEVLKLKPDLVLAGTYTRRATRNLLSRQGLKVELFPAASSVEEAKSTIRKAARLLGHEARGAALIARIDDALAAAPNFSARGLTVLQIQRRGFVSGPETLIGDLLQRLGVANAAAQMGVDRVKRASLEMALKARADALILLDPYSRAEDQGAAMLSHPALSEAFPPARRIVLPGRLVLCGGPALPLAIGELTKSLQRLSPRPRIR